MESHLLQMRGLKPKFPFIVIVCGMSHLLQMRGLKQSEYIKEYDMGSRIFYRCVD